MIAESADGVAQRVPKPSVLSNVGIKLHQLKVSFLMIYIHVQIDKKRGQVVNLRRMNLAEFLENLKVSETTCFNIFTSSYKCVQTHYILLVGFVAKVVSHKFTLIVC